MKKNKTIIVLIVIISLVLIALILMFGGFFNKSNKLDEFIKKPTSPTESSQKVEEEKTTVIPKVKNPIDFKKLQKTNTDIYGWIQVPNTNIDYPILQSYAEDDTFYLDHNMYKGYEFAGSIYTEKLNKKDFLDPNTVIYGHDMIDGSMFQNLHKFSDTKFFNDNEYFYIYTPTRKLTYQIISAYVYDDRHILNSFDFSDDKVFQEYIDFVKNPKSVDKNIRKDAEVKLKNTIVTLSTCVGYDKSLRYLVQGVLIKDEQTE